MATVYQESKKKAKGAVPEVAAGQPAVQTKGNASKSEVWSARVRVNGLDRYRSGFKTQREARRWATETEAECARYDARVKGLGPDRTSFATALRDYAHDFVVLQKGAKQAVTRINAYLLPAGLPLLRATAVSGPRSLQPAKAGVVLFELTEKPEKPLPRPFAAHRDKRLAKRENTLRQRAKLAVMPVSHIAGHHLHDLKKAMAADGLSDSTIRSELALLSAFFKRSKKIWAWKSLDNPAAAVDWPVPDNARNRVLSDDEQRRLAEALSDTRNPLVAPLIWFAIETAMRCGELLYEATWSQVDWSGRVLKLRDAKGRSREVPLTRAAMAILESLSRGKPEERIFGLTKEALDAAWDRACERAGIENLRLHDLRHTAATRHAKRLNGNIFLLQLVTGHKTLSMLKRYVNPTAKDVVVAFDETEEPVSTAPTPVSAVAPLPQNVVIFRPRSR
jgi:integrase